MWIELVICIVGIVGTLAGTIVGAFVTAYLTKRHDEERYLVELYAEVLSRYGQMVSCRNDSTTSALLSAIEKARIFCSPGTDHLLEQLACEVAKHHPHKEKCGSIVQALRQSIQKDIKSKYRKRRGD
ncbi:MAG: hypothetical protein LUH45_06770 [Clostridiales bacterium]|nr:hypothetical protein [Clostridiales bacterium]